MHWFRHLQLRWKLLIMVMPLVLVPLLLVAILITNISMELAYEGIARASRDDLKHMSSFSIAFLNDHYRQYEVYQKERENAVRQKLREIVNLAYALVMTHYQQFLMERLPLKSVKQAARDSLKSVDVGMNGDIAVLDSSGRLVTPQISAEEKANSSANESADFDIHEMTEKAIRSIPGEVLYLKHPLQEGSLDGPQREGEKIIAYRYFPGWNWIISAGSFQDRVDENQPVDGPAFAELKRQLKEKKVGESGLIYAASCSGELVIHPSAEGREVGSWLDEQGMAQFQKLCERAEPSAWLESEWAEKPGGKTRARITRLEYFRPWNWVVFVEAYEDELFGTAEVTNKLILGSVIFLSFLVSAIAGMLSFYVAGRFTFPIYKMTREIERAKGSRQVKKITVPEAEELRKLAIAFNTMSDLIQRDKVLEEKLARMEKMASIGVLSSNVAHEINNPMGVILGYACHLETKLDKNDPNYHFIQEIKEESRRCVKIVRNLLDYARVPNLNATETDLNKLLEQTVDFAAGHAELENIVFVKEFSELIKPIKVDEDQLRQVVMNLVLNGAAAMKKGGELKISTRKQNEGVVITVSDSGTGIAPEHLKEVYEPFFTTKDKGTGLGLAISRQIVEAHLGSMKIESVVGRGTTVTIILPA